MDILINILKITIVPIAAVMAGAILVFLERKVAGLIQSRWGPSQLPIKGIGFLLADAIKIFFKEEIFPDKVDRLIFLIAPVLSFSTGMITFAVIPFAAVDALNVSSGVSGLDINVGILWILSFASMGVYGVAFGGWASFSKYSLFGGLRSVAQLVSFEIAMGLTLISLIMATGSIHLNEMVLDQTYADTSNGLFLHFLPNWLIFRQPLAFILFITAGFAEINRNPLDLPEAEQELVGGYYTEYSSWKFGAFMFADYVAAIPMAALITTLFLGGWHFPGLDKIIDPGLGFAFASFGVFAVKFAFMIFVLIWVRWTLPRFRYDQFMKLGWRVMVPLAILNLIITGIYNKIDILFK